MTLKGHSSFKRLNRLGVAFIGALLALTVLPIYVHAAETADVDIHVTMAGTKSVLITGATSYDYGALSVDTSSVSTAAIVVQNNSSVFIQTYTITGANAISASGGTDWSINTSTGPNQYALSAQFSGSRPADNNGTWTDDDLSLSPSVCSATDHGNGTEAEAGSSVLPGANRNLWFRIKTPSSVTDGGQHNITVTISIN